MEHGIAAVSNGRSEAPETLEALEAPDDRTAPTAPEPAPTPGLFVYREPVPGGFRVNYEVLGDIDPLAAPALLELAASAARQRVGLQGR